MSTEFQEYVCWRDDAVLAVSPRDAASLTEAHFQAIHHPLRLRRRRLDQREGGEWSTEVDVLDALKGPLRPDGYLFIPIVGGSGTGKSHLVRWVRDQSENESNWEIRYLPKNRTGLRRAIEIVIRGLNGPRIDEARAALLEAPAQSESDTVLAERLLDELALLVSQLDVNSPGRMEDQRTAQLRKKLSRELPDLLRDPVVRRKLVADGAVIQRLVGLALRGREEGDGLDDDATHFLDSDFPDTFVEIGDATRVARDLLGKLAIIPSLKAAAVAMINEALPAAEKRVAVSGQVDLVEVFREVRRALHSEGQQLAFFVEDLTVLHGVEREFLDAIVEPTHSDDGEMCGLRMIFAVTEGHFDGLDTVRTRCDDAYWLDAPYGDNGVDHEEALSFVARYFNATRQDPQSIDTAWKDRPTDGSNWLANACTSCVHQDICGDSFGTSREGYGLYPLNKEAASRFVSALSSDRFDPRDVVREIINRFLLQSSSELRRGSFPSSSTMASFDQHTDPLSPLIATKVRSARPNDHEQISNVLRFWSNANSAVAVGESVLQAFGVEGFSEGLNALQNLESMDGSRNSRRIEGKVKSKTKEGGTDDQARSRVGIEEQLKPAPRRHFDELTAWSKNQSELSATATNYLRKAVLSTIQQNLEFSATPVNLGEGFDRHRFGEMEIAIAGSVSQQSRDNVVLAIARDEVSAAALQALILFKEIDSDGWPQSGEYRRLLASALEGWIEVVTAKLTQLPVEESTAGVVRAAIVSSAVLGGLGSNPTNVEYISALFASTGPATVSANRTAKWTALVERASKRKVQLQNQIEAEFGESRGKAGGVRMVQADLLLPIVKDFVSTWQIDTTDPVDAPFLRAITPAIDEEWAILQSMVAEVEGLIDSKRSWEDQTGRVLATLRTAHELGRISDATALSELSKLAERDPTRMLRSFADAADAVKRTLALSEKLAIVASEIPDDVAVIRQFSVRASAAFENVESSLASRHSESGGVTDLEKAAARVLESTNRFDEAVRRIAK